MKFHEVDIIGEHFIERLSSEPIYTVDDKRRLAFVESIGGAEANTIIVGGKNQWYPFFGIGTINVTSSPLVSASSVMDTLTFVNGSGVSFLTEPTTKNLTVLSSNNFENIGNAIATTSDDTIIFVAGPGISLFSNPTTRTINFYASPTFGKIQVGASTISMLSSNAVLNIVGGGGITITTNPGTKTINIDPDNSFFINGRRMWLYENVAPNGWTIFSSTADSLVGIKAPGTGGYYDVAGGNFAGIWLEDSHNHIEFAHSHDGPPHIHTFYPPHNHTVADAYLGVYEIPKHAHVILHDWYEIAWNQSGNNGLSGLSGGPAKFQTTMENFTSATGSNVGHSHGSIPVGGLPDSPQETYSSFSGTGSPTTDNVSLATESNTWRPLAHVGILVERNASAFPSNPVRTLSIGSIPVSGSSAHVKVFPIDINGNSDGDAPFTRQYYMGTTVALIAPGVFPVSDFIKWQVNGGDYSTDTLMTISADSNYTVTAIYQVNLVPVLSSLNPSGATAGDPGFEMDVYGTGFVSGSVAKWNGSDRTTTFDSSTHLTATISVSDIASPATNSVTVFNPTPGGGTSNTLSFVVSFAGNTWYEESADTGHNNYIGTDSWTPGDNYFPF